MTVDRQEMKQRIQEYARGNDRCNWFSEDELIDLGLQADERANKSGEKFIGVFDQLVFEKSFEKGAPK